MRSTEDPATQRSTPRLIAAAAAADTLLILTFAAIGRDAHSRGESVAGVLAHRLAVPGRRGSCLASAAGCGTAPWQCGRPALRCGSAPWESGCCSAR